MPTPHHNNFLHAVSVLTLKHDPMPLDLRDINKLTDGAKPKEVGHE